MAMANSDRTNVENRLIQMAIGAAKLISFVLIVVLLLYMFRLPIAAMALIFVVSGVFGLLDIGIPFVVLCLAVVLLWKGKPQQRMGAFALVFACVTAYGIYWTVFVVGEKWAQKTQFSARSTIAVDHQGNNLGLMYRFSAHPRDCYQLENCYLPLIYGFADTVTITSNQSHRNTWETKAYTLSRFDKCDSDSENDKWLFGLQRLQSHGLFLQCIELLQTVESSDLYETLPDGLVIRTSWDDPSLIRPFTSKKKWNKITVATQVIDHEAASDIRRWEHLHYPFTKKWVGTEFYHRQFITALYGHKKYPLEVYFEISLDEAIERALSAAEHDHFQAEAALNYLVGVNGFEKSKGQGTQSSASENAALLYWQLMRKGCGKLESPASCIEKYEKASKKLGIVAKPE